MTGLVRHTPCSGVDVVWAVPTGGYGHLADEQSLPYLHRTGLELTPRFGGEASWPACAPQTLGLPWGILKQPWPMAQRVFNGPRRAINRYWREIFRSRNDKSGLFLFWDQLDYQRTDQGFKGCSAVARFERRFIVEPRRIEVHDSIAALSILHFKEFSPLVIPLFPDWTVNEVSSCWLEIDLGSARLEPCGQQSSAAGQAVLWTLKHGETTLQAGQLVEHRYIYHF